MHYQINVALHGSHLFATAEHSLRTEYQMKEVLLIFKKKFPESEGYSITLTKYHNRGEIIPVDSIQ